MSGRNVTSPTRITVADWAAIATPTLADTNPTIGCIIRRLAMVVQQFAVLHAYG